MRKTASILSPENQAQILEPFISAASLTLREWAGTDVAVQDVRQEPRLESVGAISARLRLLSGPFSALMVSSSAPTAAALARRIVTEAGAEVDDGLIRDCLGEVANIIAGQAKALLAGTPYHFTFSTPEVLSGPNEEAQLRQDQECLVVVFASDAGEIALHLCLRR